MQATRIHIALNALAGCSYDGRVSTTFDAARYKATTHAQWQEAAEAWNRWSNLLRRWLGPATEQMLDMANIGPGSTVLDVAAGAGDQTLQAAARVGPKGRVLATDLSSNILDFARANALAAGFEHVDILVADGEDLPVDTESFDAVISRVGLIYFPDQVAALTGMRRALRPGGRCAAITYSTADKNGFFSIPVSIIRRRAALPAPAPGQPGPFSLGDPEVATSVFRQAGFKDIQTRVLSAPVLVPSAADCLRFEQESFGALHQLLSGLDDDGKAEAWAEIERELMQFETPSGFEGPCELVLIAGTK